MSQAVELDAVVHAKTKQVADWGIDYIKISKMWSKNYTGKGVKVAILDTGIDTSHPDLKVHGGVSYVKGVKSYNDDEGHGTHVAGIVAAKDNKIGSVGVAHDAKLYAVKVMDKHGTGTVANLTKGINWSIKNKMNIINMSLGLEEYEIGDKNFYAFKKSIERAYDAGIIIVASSGNDGKKLVNYPARWNDVIGVGAITQYTKHDDDPITYIKEDFSNYGKGLDFVAPGSFIYSTFPVKMKPFLGEVGYEYYSGTSMSAPYMAGFMAILKGKYPKLTNRQLRVKARGYTKDLGKKGKDDKYGYGVIRAK